MHFLREDEALKTMGLFEGAEENERVTKKSLKNWVVLNQLLIGVRKYNFTSEN